MMVYAAPLADLQGLRVFAAMQLVEAHNKCRRAIEELPILEEEMRQYMAYCKQRLHLVMADIAATRQAIMQVGDEVAPVRELRVC